MSHKHNTIIDTNLYNQTNMIQLAVVGSICVIGFYIWGHHIFRQNTHNIFVFIPLFPLIMVAITKFNKILHDNLELPGTPDEMIN